MDFVIVLVLRDLCNDQLLWNTRLTVLMTSFGPTVVSSIGVLQLTVHVT